MSLFLLLAEHYQSFTNKFYRANFFGKVLAADTARKFFNLRILIICIFKLSLVVR